MAERLEFDVHDSDSLVLSDIRELLFLLALAKADAHPGGFIERKLNEFRSRRQRKVVDNVG